MCFVRAPNGQFTTFIPPGAGTGDLQACSSFTTDTLNDVGAMAGYNIDANLVEHGWVRTRDGKITTFDVPGGGTGAFQGTYTAGINLGGTVPGWVTDSDSVTHGFVRSPSGNLTTFDVTGAAQGPARGRLSRPSTCSVPSPDGTLTPAA